MREPTRKPVVLVGGRFLPLAQAAKDAFRLHASGRLAQAGKIYDAIVSAAPDDAAARQGRGLARFQSGDMPGAVADLEHARRLRPDDVGLLCNLGQVLLASGRREEALLRFAEAVTAAPGDAAAQNGLGSAYRATGDLERAADHYRRATSLAPDLADSWLNLGAVEQERDRVGEAIRCFEKAAAVRPDAETHALIAATLERAGELEAAEEAARKALVLDPRHAGAHLAQARVWRRQGDLKRAAPVFRDLVSRLADATDRRELRLRAGAAQELAQVLESQGLYAEAWEHFRLANGTQRRANPDIDALAASFRDQAARLLRSFADEGFLAALPRTATAGAARREPVFLVGFPRSGTTLLVRALTALPTTAVFDEKPLLSAVLRRLRTLGIAYPEGLSGMSPEILEELRACYWQAARSLRPGVGDQLLFIDKDPANTVHLGLIHALFPFARVVFSIRDPRDACLSSFGNIFRLTPLLATFNTLEGTAETFAQFIQLWRLYRDKLGLAAHVVRYEDLVADFPTRMQGLLAFLGLPWDEAAVDYDAQKNAPLVRTPSYDQVSLRPYRSAVGRWRNFEAEFDRARTILREALEELHYV